MVSQKTQDELGFSDIVKRIAPYFFCCENPQYFLRTRPTTDRTTLAQYTTKLQAFIAICAERSSLHLLSTYLPFAELIKLKGSFDVETCQEIVKVVFNNECLSKWLAGNDFFTYETQCFGAARGLVTFSRQHFSDEGQLREESIGGMDELQRKKKKLIRNRESAAMQFMKRDTQNLSPTVTGSRLTVPIPHTKKRAHDGIIHSYSNTGQTVFFEPKELFELNNDLESIDQEISELVFAFCQEYKALVKNNARELMQAHASLLELDVYQAIQQYLSHIHAAYTFATTHCFDVEANNNAELPDIYLRQIQNSLIANCQAIDIYMAAPCTQCVITGANAGGKTAALKTLGLAVLLNQSGMPICAQEGARLPLFFTLELIIGDYQNLEKGTSHFSSHLDEIARVQAERSPPSLILIDEICSGTDAHEGAALACAVLKQLNTEQTFSVVTTHLSLLKSYALAQSHIEVVCVGFEESKPYVLTYGTIGKSEVARLLAKRKEFFLFFKDYTQFVNQFGRTEDEYILKLNERVSAFKQKTDELVQKTDELEILKREQERLLRDLHDQKLKYRVQELEKSSEYIAKHKRVLKEIEQAKQKILESNRKEALQTIELPKHMISELQAEHALKTTELENVVRASTTLELHDIVEIEGFDTKGKVVSKNQDDTVRVQIGSFTLDLNAHMLTKTSPSPSRGHSKTLKKTKAKVLLEKENSKNTDSTQSPALDKALDVRGKYLIEALPLVESHINQSLLEGRSYISIIHGKGELGRKLKQRLSNYPEIIKIDAAQENDGGEGKSYCHLV